MTSSNVARLGREPQKGRRPAIGLGRRKTLLRVFALAVMLIYSVVTIFPFYVLIIRSFVPTKESVELHLWIPETEEVSLDAEVGNLSVFYDLDLRDLKDALGIPQTEFIMARTTLREVAEKYDIPEQAITDFFAGFYTYNGWITVLTGDLQSTTFWGALLKTLAVTAISLVILISLSICTGYGLAGLGRKDQRFVYNVYLLQMVIPAMLLLLPQYQLLQWIMRLFPDYVVQGSNTRAILQLSSIVLINVKGTALSTMIFSSAIAGVPKDIEDSAMIDGASRMQYLRHILLPLLKVPVVSLTVIQLPLIYNQFLEPYVYLDPSNSTLLPYIQSISGQFSTNYQVIYASVLGSVVPIVVVYLIFRRFFVEGAMAGAIKG